MFAGVSRCTAAGKNVFLLKRSWWKMRTPNAGIPLVFVSQRGSDEDIDRCSDVFGPGLLARFGGEDGMHE
jgi:hypothetical protein